MRDGQTDDTRLSATDDTRLSPEDNTRLVHSDGTRLSATDDTVIVDEATVVAGPTPLTDLSEVRIPPQRPSGSPDREWPRMRVPGGEEFFLHRPIALGRQPRTPLGPLDRILLLSWDPRDREVSGTHVLLEATDTAVIVTDLGSRNGTRVQVPGAPFRLLGPRQSCVVTGEATVEFGATGKIEIVPAG